MKQFLMVVACVVLFVTQVIAQKTVTVPTQQIQIGTFASTGSNLSNGSGDRQISVPISFPNGFKEKPDVMVAITMLDIDNSANTRVVVTAAAVGRDGFTAVIKTWSNSKISGVSGTWIAVAPTTTTVKVK